MAVLNLPGVPPISEPMSWAEICAAYPDQYVGLTNIVTEAAKWWDIRSAQVFCCGSYATVLAQVGRGGGRRYPDSRHVFTGAKRVDAEALFAFKLASYRSR